MSIFNSLGKKAEHVAEQHATDKIITDLARDGKAVIPETATIYCSDTFATTIHITPKTEARIRLERKHFIDSGEYHEIKQ